MTGDRAQTRVKLCFEDFGYSVNELSKDYGEDLLVRIFDRTRATPYVFLVQSKGGGRNTRTRQTSGSDGARGYRVRVSRQHQDLWSKLALPVLLTYWDEGSDQIYWQFIPVELYMWPPETQPDPLRSSIHIPLTHKLDKKGITYIRNEVSERHALPSRMGLCIESLMHIITANTKLCDIYCDPQSLIIKYSDHPGGMANVLFLGDAAELLDLLAERDGVANVPKYIKASLDYKYGAGQSLSERNQVGRHAFDRSLAKVRRQLRTRRRATSR